MKRTIVHLVDSEIFGGCEQVVLTLLKGLDGDRFRPVLLYCESPAMPPLARAVSSANIEALSVPRITSRNRVAGFWRVAARLRGLKPDIFHVHLNWPLACRNEMMAARLAGVGAVVATSHLTCSLSDVRFGWIKRQIQNLGIDRYIAVSNNVADWLCRDMGVRPSKARIVKNGVSVGSFGQPENAILRNEILGGSSRPLVLSSGRLHSEKGFAYLLEAAKLVPEALFLLAGDGPDRIRLEEYARKIGVEGQVRFLGHREDVPQLLALCDVFVLPSLHEALGLSVLEAMAAGKPVVATSVGGLKESVIDGITGLLVPPEDSQSLAAAIRKMLSDHALASRLAEAGRANVIQFFSSEKMIQGTIAVYEELMDKRWAHEERPTPASGIETRLNA